MYCLFSNAKISLKIHHMVKDLFFQSFDLHCPKSMQYRFYADTFLTLSKTKILQAAKQILEIGDIGL